MKKHEKLEIVPVEQIPLGQIVDLEKSNLTNVYKTCLQLKELCERSAGIGIAAVQAGIPLNLFLVKYPTGYSYFANCSYRPASEEKILHLEGCLSLVTPTGRMRTFSVERYKNILISGFQILDKSELVCKQLTDYSVSDFYAAVFQHEADHQNGILISEIGTEVEIYN